MSVFPCMSLLYDYAIPKIVIILTYYNYIFLQNTLTFTSKKNTPKLYDILEVKPIMNKIIFSYAHR